MERPLFCLFYPLWWGSPWIPFCSFSQQEDNASAITRAQRPCYQPDEPENHAAILYSLPGLVKDMGPKCLVPGDFKIKLRMYLLSKLGDCFNVSPEAERVRIRTYKTQSIPSNPLPPRARASPTITGNASSGQDMDILPKLSAVA